jgi:hypothetical protein
VWRPMTWDPVTHVPPAIETYAREFLHRLVGECALYATNREPHERNPPLGVRCPRCQSTVQAPLDEHLQYCDGNTCPF